MLLVKTDGSMDRFQGSGGDATRPSHYNQSTHCSTHYTATSFGLLYAHRNHIVFQLFFFAKMITLDEAKEQCPSRLLRRATTCLYVCVRVYLGTGNRDERAPEKTISNRVRVRTTDWMDRSVRDAPLFFEVLHPEGGSPNGTSGRK